MPLIEQKEIEILIKEFDTLGENGAIKKQSIMPKIAACVRVNKAWDDYVKSKHPEELHQAITLFNFFCKPLLCIYCEDGIVTLQKIFDRIHEEIQNTVMELDRHEDKDIVGVLLGQGIGAKKISAIISYVGRLIKSKQTIITQQQVAKQEDEKIYQIVYQVGKWFVIIGLVAGFTVAAILTGGTAAIVIGGCGIATVGGVYFTNLHDKAGDALKECWKYMYPPELVESIVEYQRKCLADVEDLCCVVSNDNVPYENLVDMLSDPNKRIPDVITGIRAALQIRQVSLLQDNTGQNGNGLSQVTVSNSVTNNVTLNPTTGSVTVRTSLQAEIKTAEPEKSVKSRDINSDKLKQLSVANQKLAGSEINITSKHEREENHAANKSSASTNKTDKDKKQVPVAPNTATALASLGSIPKALFSAKPGTVVVVPPAAGKTHVIDINPKRQPQLQPIAGFQR